MSDQNPVDPPANPAPPAYEPPAAPPYGQPQPPAPYGQPQAPYGQAPAPAYGQPQNPAYAQPGYPQPGYPAAPYGGYPTQPRTNTLAIISLIASLAGVFLLPIVGQIVGIITGHMSLAQIGSTGEGGRGLGLAGTIIGWVTLGLWILGILLFFAIIIPLAVTSGDYSQA
ncbi:DUF4190 domain-containing protein [Microbacterium terricola]|uniref:DUF4190 domain-containing protein n=1 Tax=Microbacterium terricola TaxID=344163 RepID=UPI0021E70CB6|nr:DUF4190 domain-containing protein [Microbacterium terricola]UYK38819.1 DUF4190 domain-containing protein [Microbacterium terricola]